jgi:hypothetical protein
MSHLSSPDFQVGADTCEATKRLALRNRRHNTLNSNELYVLRIIPAWPLSAKRQFLTQATNPEVFVNAS